MMSRSSEIGTHKDHPSRISRRRHRRSRVGFMAQKPAGFDDWLNLLPQSILAAVVFFVSVRICTRLIFSNSAGFLFWLVSTNIGPSTFTLLRIITGLFLVYVTFDVLIIYQRRGRHVVWSIFYFIFAVFCLGLSYYGFYIGEKFTKPALAELGPIHHRQLDNVELPYTSESCDYPEVYQPFSVLVTLNKSGLVIGTDRHDVIELTDGWFHGNAIEESEVGDFIPELGNRLVAARYRVEEKRVRGRRYILEPPELYYPGRREYWPPGKKRIMIIANKETPFETIQKILVTAGLHGFGKWCILTSTQLHRLYPYCMELPRFESAKAKKGSRPSLDLRVFLERDRFHLSAYFDKRIIANEVYNYSMQEDWRGTANIEIEEKLKQQLRKIKEFDREETRCVFKVSPNTHIGNVLKTMCHLSGKQEERLFPDVLFTHPNVPAAD